MITQPYVNFILPDAGGNVKPISNGTIYIGKEGLDPKQGGNPIYYRDNEGTEVEISNPLYLNSTGVIVSGPNSSNAINPYTKGPISILILDQNGQGVWSELSNVSQFVESSSLPLYTNIQVNNIDDLFNSRTIGGLTFTRESGQVIGVNSAYNYGGQSFWQIINKPAEINLGDGLYAKLMKKTVVYAEDFGVKPGIDCTQPFWVLMDYVESIGGAIVQLPAGDLEISMAKSNDSNACVTIPANTLVRGEGMYKTNITRPDSDRETNGLLLVNRGWKTSGGLTAAGNIVLEDFSIDDGDPSKSRPTGDLIAISHAENVLIRRVRGLNHDQHFVDLAGAKNVEITQCVCKNQASLGQNATAIIQIDKAGGLYGSLDDNTGCENIKIHNNILTQESDSLAVQLCHGGATGGTFYRNIQIEDNVISVSNPNRDCIGIDNRDNIILMGLWIHSNTFNSTNAFSRCINLFIDKASSKLDGINISGNFVQGLSRSFAYVGASSSSSSIATVKNVVISENIGSVLSNGSPVASLITVVGVQNSVITSNPLTLEYNGTVNSGNVVIDSCNGLLFNSNTITSIFDGNKNTSTVRIMTNLNNLIKTNITLRGNVLDCSNVNYCIDSEGIASDAEVLVSGTVFTGSDPVVAHIREGDTAISDGTNGYHQLDLGGADGSLSISASQYSQGLSLGLKKAGKSLSKARVDLQFASTLAGLSTDAEEITFGLANASGAEYDCAGTQVVDINQNEGTFSIVTGNLGVSFVINNVLFKAVARNSGFIKAYAGI